ncbi:Histone acetyltransferase HPA2 [Labilithrix luteola]|uniref:Histone acetyltransferase HPA2 n=1 Tax=Labilithrix luteola TaxID=1391654 RepID=A0A0K1QF61_9BACT|nr:GNAT family N-acetyltransferase [Labilithrix luteola]AKV04399.1 Histone acetyltransferase HPA2 [Labilithrix luteola]
MITDKPSLSFRPIDIARDAALCLEFRADSYEASFGDANEFWRDAGAGGEAYLRKLAERSEAWPGSCAHVWRADDCVGQVELRSDGDLGYVNLFYVRPDLRGTGLGRLEHEYSIALFRSAGFDRAYLYVSETNVQARGFYERMGWHTTGRRPGSPQLLRMERAL